MHAAVVRSFDRPPEYAEWPEPVPAADEILVSPTAAAVQPLVRSRAAGIHYSAHVSPPFVPGVDGVGRTADGRRVYFVFPRPPNGTLAERVAVPSARTVPLPDGLDDTVAAAAANAGMGSWVPLTRLAPIRDHASVLVNGASGTAGRTAIQVAKHLGAGRVVATARRPAQFPELRALGADLVLDLSQPEAEFRSAVRSAAAEERVGIVVDYLWGAPALSVLTALGGPDAPRGPDRIRFVHVGSVAGPTVLLPGELLRSSGIELLGSGIGSSSNEDLLVGIAEFLRAIVPAGFRIDLVERPLAQVATAWNEATDHRRLVFRIA